MSDIPQTYAEQAAHFADNFRDAIWELSTLVSGIGVFSPEEFAEMCRVRLLQGHEQYGATMYEWDAETRRRNVLEEIVDAVVYLTSGPIS